MKKISLLNDLSNDLFLEIFDYLDVLHLFQAFFNLNQRFNLLIIDQRICFQSNMISIKFNEFLIYKNLILPKIGSYIRYLTISDELNYLQIIFHTISFKNLIYVKLYDIHLNEFKFILQYSKLKYLFINTKYIQNEKHLNNIFNILFNQQLDLCSIECHFHTNLYFHENQYKLSQLKRIIINSECFSSDFIVLISQLPKLRHINARINDYNREYMDKDIDHLTGNQCLRSLILHIENIELDRLLLILSLTSNVRIIELNGKIDFDINYLFELERNYTSFRYMNYKFVSLNIIYLIGLILFLNGFLLTRRVILQNSNGIIPSTKPNEFNQIILIIIDALRYDFIKPNKNLTNNNNNYQNQMLFINELLETKSNQTILLRLIADPPTTTLQRLKALTTGTLPTFIDISYNFIGYEIEEDNILNQLKNNSYERNISLLGDDTWLALYPNIKFKHLYVYPSFDVHDLDTVDNGILQHLWKVIDDKQSSFIIAHFLGVDHCGHRYGPTHIEMKRKLNQMNDVIKNITLSLNKSNLSSLLIVIGDHGMTQQGDHGGDELNEIETAMFIYTNKQNYFSSLKSNEELTVSQIDLVPTLSWFLHILIPFSNLGMIITDLIPIEQRYNAMKLNFEQIEIYLQYISLTLPLSDKLQELRANLRTIFISIDRERNLTITENLFQEFKYELQTYFRRQWSTFNITRIISGLIIMLISCIILVVIYFKLSQNLIVINISLSLMYFFISFSNSFIINEGMCLYFLLQTIILLTKMKVLQKLSLSFLLFLSRTFFICREEQQPYCVDHLWLVSKTSDTDNYFLPFLATITWLIILYFICHYSYFLLYISFISIVIYWFNISYTLSIFYLSILMQICFVIFNPSHFDKLIYSILIFVVGYRFSFVIFLEYFIYYIISINTNTNNHQSLPLFLSILTEYFFYATGHQPVISQIRWTAAFPTLNSPLNNYLSLIINSLFIRGLFVLIETYSSQILNIIFIRKMLEKKYHNDLLKSILIIDCWKLMITSLSVFIFRRHLMLWKIFSPRFLFQLVGVFIKFLVVFLTIKLKK